MKTRVTRISAVAVILWVIMSCLWAHDPRARTPIHIPDIPGYKTLKCDFHIHTVFSDGTVWPDIRPEEAWREGLDAIAITDHIEYQPHREDLPTSHNRGFEIARPHGEALDVIVIHGSEVTRDMPPGHINAIFLQDSVPLETENWRDALKAAGEQEAFIFWNHPSWERQQPDGVPRWYPEHTEIHEQGLLHGIEVVNGRDYDPEVHRIALEKNLVMLSNSDIHMPLNLDYHVHQGDHRPVTLVFAREKTEEAIKEALFQRRTAVYSGNLLIGDRSLVTPILALSIAIQNPSVTVEGTGRAYVRIQNTSDITYELRGEQDFEEIEAPEELDLQAGKTVLLELRGKSRDRSGQQVFRFPYTVQNVKIGPDESLPLTLSVEVNFVPDPEEE